MVGIIGVQMAAFGGDEGEAMFVVWRGGEEMLAVAGEGGEAVLAVVGEVVRMAWFVEMRSWLWRRWLALWLVVGVVVGGWSKLTIEKE